MENDLFNRTLLKKHSKKFKLTPTKYDLLKEYVKKVEKDDFKSETKNYLYFYDVILKALLGYKREDVLFDEKGDVGTGRSEFVLKSDDKKFMVIELKGQGINLDKRQSGRSDNKSPVEQAFGYAINTGDVDWIMVSNYDEFRLYNYHEKTNYISFTARELLDKETFAFFMLAFSRESHIESGYINEVKDRTLVVDRKLASEFYKLYNETRLMLIKELETVNQMERLDAIHYSQLILNRYMFICFAEDTNLLPSQISIDTIATPIQKGNIRHRSIWQRLNELCLDINEGNEFKKINEYNGGLFAEDLDFLKIRDIVDDQSLFKDTYQNWNFTEYEKDITHLLGTAKNRINPIYRNMLTISSFDFSTELDVNILGHIFENSIGDIEELKEDSKERRKKEGIFYTPDYITDYICRNTIIPYLSISGDSNKVEDLMVEYWGSKIEELDEKVKKIKIVDPACGSGAFLNKAADVLLEIHQAIHQERYKDKKGTLAPYFDNIGERREILLNNIYGVDLNEESTEITKLSLFLKVCRKGLKLPNLDNNIKCGNSLIDEFDYTDKPFNWKNEFSEIFHAGGFDIVIGNPPYVRTHGLSKEEKKYYANHFKSAYKQYDIYVLFMELCIKILKNKGLLGYIVSNKFATADYGLKIREKILNECIIKNIVDVSSLPIFKDASVYPYIITWKKKDNHGKTDGTLIKIVSDINDEYDFIEGDYELSEIPQERYNNNPNFIFDVFKFEIFHIIEKLESANNLGEITEITRGFRPPTPELLITESDFKLLSDKKSQLNKFITGKELKGPYRIEWSGDYLEYKKEMINEYKSPEVFEQPKILMRDISLKPEAYFDDDYFYCLKTIYIILQKDKKYSLKYITSILNSKLTDFYFKSRFWASHIGGNYLRFRKQYIEQIPIYAATPEEQQSFIKKTDEMIQLNKKLQKEVKGFKHWIIKEFNAEKLSKKLENYYELSEKEFINELKKKKVDTKSRKNREYLEREFRESLAIIKPLLHKIKQTDDEINQRVYELYDLNDDEITIIKNNSI